VRGVADVIDAADGRRDVPTVGDGRKKSSGTPLAESRRSTVTDGRATIDERRRVPGAADAAGAREWRRVRVGECAPAAVEPAATSEPVISAAAAAASSSATWRGRVEKGFLAECAVKTPPTGATLRRRRTSVVDGARAAGGGIAARAADAGVAAPERGRGAAKMSESGPAGAEARPLTESMIVAAVERRCGVVVRVRAETGGSWRAASESRRTFLGVAAGAAGAATDGWRESDGRIGD
jgi:hypothetical protein